MPASLAAPSEMLPEAAEPCDDASLCRMDEHDERRLTWPAHTTASHDHQDQSETITFLKAKAASLGLPVETISTHISSLSLGATAP